jgi:molybdopterin/thiamine biosynthesis adenylyltransferase
LAFARAGIGELRFLDGDHVSLGTLCRWPLGFTAAGGGKVKELEQFILRNYPLTRIGSSHYPPGKKKDFRVTIGAHEANHDQWECLEKLIEEADLIYDATAEPGINQLLCDLAIHHKIPYVTVSARAGGWGGNVVRVWPDGPGGCYLCYLHALAAGDIPQPPYDPHGDELQPVGCGDITFKAAGFDVEEIALAGVRMAASTLCERTPGGYPPIFHDIGILCLRDQETGNPIFPQWHTAPLHKHPKCGVCNK